MTELAYGLSSEEHDARTLVGIAHTLPLEQAPEAYAMFQAKRDGAVKVVLTP